MTHDYVALKPLESNVPWYRERLVKITVCNYRLKWALMVRQNSLIRLIVGWPNVKLLISLDITKPMRPSVGPVSFSPDFLPLELENQDRSSHQV